MLSVIVPVYDERESLPPLVEELRAALRPLGTPYEIVLVDDGSTDGSERWVADAARASKDVVAVLFERNAGQSAAFAAGFAHARGDVLVTIDGDGQNDPADIPRLLEALERADVVSGVRADRRDDWKRRLSSRVANGVRRAVIGDHVTDIGCSLKAYRRAAVEGIPFFTTAHRFLAGLCELRGARVVEIPVRHRPRAAGVSKYGMGNRLFRGIRDLFGVRWLRSRLLRYRVREVIHG
ncbi:MAG TPA: glycosyltransferase family 2 protein [Candidatus Eisenbacteria bacterium]